VPAIARWPGVIPAARTTEQPAITMDWTATILAVTGTAPHPAYPLDGEDLMPVCQGKPGPADRLLFWRTQTRDAARMGTWKYLKESGNEHLFDLSIDPGEKNDVRTLHAGIFEKVRNHYLAWDAQMLPRLDRS
jgi:arylsulfatase A-like enzyme